MGELTVQPAEPDDVQAILGLLGQLGRPCDSSTGGATRDIAHSILDRGDTRILTARMDERILGAACMMFVDRLGHSRPEARLLDLVVAEDCRSAGVGRVLVDAVITLARDADCRILRLECAHWRQDAQRFYRRLGFESRGEDWQLSLDTNSKVRADHR